MRYSNWWPAFRFENRKQRDRSRYAGPLCSLVAASSAGGGMTSARATVNKDRETSVWMLAEERGRREGPRRSPRSYERAYERFSERERREGGQGEGARGARWGRVREGRG